MLSAQGGVEIETVAETDPDAIAKIWIDPVDGLSESVAREWVEAAKLNPDATDGAVDILLKLYRAYTEGDADLVEINPLTLKPTGEVPTPLDAKVTLDGLAAAFRHDWADYEAHRARRARAGHRTREGPAVRGPRGFGGHHRQRRGARHEHPRRGQPGGWLGVELPRHRRRCRAEVMTGALEVINNDPSVKAIFINIFGGITRGEEVANGIVEALNRVTIDSPIVIRLDGTNADEGRSILEPHLSDSLQMQPTMLDAARKVVELAG